MRSATYAITLFIGLIVSSHAERILPPQDIHSQIAAAHARAIEAQRRLNCLGELARIMQRFDGYGALGAALV
jgi:hypothetical protein